MLSALWSLVLVRLVSHSAQITYLVHGVLAHPNTQGAIVFCLVPFPYPACFSLCLYACHYCPLFLLISSVLFRNLSHYVRDRSSVHVIIVYFSVLTWFSRHILYIYSIVFRLLLFLLIPLAPSNTSYTTFSFAPTRKKSSPTLTSVWFPPASLHAYLLVVTLFYSLYDPFLFP